jgi:hypothetical protein
MYKVMLDILVNKVVNEMIIKIGKGGLRRRRRTRVTYPKSLEK